jgi:hypothetical protein
MARAADWLFSAVNRKSTRCFESSVLTALSIFPDSGSSKQSGFGSRPSIQRVLGIPVGLDSSLAFCQPGTGSYSLMALPISSDFLPKSF